MIEWQDDAVVLAARNHGETSIIALLLTREHGRHAGLVHGGQSAKARPVYQPGNQVTATWRARLADQLGSFACELVHSNAARVLDDADRLNALTAATAVCDRALPEREPHPACFDGLIALIAALDGDFWAEIYVRWEIGLLADLGFGLDLTSCAAGGDSAQLAYVSPRSGRAVSRDAGEPYKEKLLALPGFLTGQGHGGPEEIAQGLEMTGFFLARHVFHPQNQELPAPRCRLRERFSDSVAKPSLPP